jgi:hypothetical protein
MDTNITRLSLLDVRSVPPFNPLIAGRTLPPEPVAVDVDVTVLGTYVGTYEMESGVQFRTRLQDDQLAIQRPDGKWTRLSAESETRLFAPQTDYRFNFEVDAKGAVTGVRFEIQGLALPLVKKIA